ncbi:ABC transporter permease [archaeon]|nr:ABC transporter permease [archaeon]MBL7051305.1 ABC transporter permease [Candidatus Woesearchaeota archaeon]
MAELKKLWNLSIQLAKTDIKIRNEGSYLGFLWYLLNPLALFLLLLLVFHDRLGQGIEMYPLYLLLGIIVFNFFQKTSSFSIDSIMKNAGLIKSIKFSNKSIIISVVLRSVFEHIFEIIVFLTFLIWFQISLGGIIFYPLILIIFGLFIFGVSLILSSLTIYFADLKNLWVFISRLLWFATPIFYNIGGQTRLFYFNLFNPLYYFITISREILIHNRIPELWLIFGMVGFALLFFVIGLFVFGRLEHKFPEMI